MPTDHNKSVSIKDKLHAKAESLEEPSRVRLHRAISWLSRAESESEDQDAQFIFLWIAFNAAYAREFGFEESSRQQLKEFFAKLLTVDSSHRFRALLFKDFSSTIRTLVGNKFVFEPFWRALRDHDASGRWKTQFDLSVKAAMKAIVSGETGIVLSIVFDRLYVLRNQLVHGGATWNSKINRSQVKDGATILMAFIPAMIDLMLDHTGSVAGDIQYPVV